MFKYDSETGVRLTSDVYQNKPEAIVSMLSMARFAKGRFEGRLIAINIRQQLSVWHGFYSVLSIMVLVY